jgi:hypothetical protein
LLTSASERRSLGLEPGEKESNVMRFMLGGVLTLSLLLPMGGLAAAKCHDDGNAVENARAQVEANCSCAEATSHGEYVSCAAGVTRDAEGLAKNCRGSVKRCAARSTCGKPGFVVCCFSRHNKTKCKVTRAALCEASGVPSACTSVCDAGGDETGPSCASSPSGAFLDAAESF